MQRTLLMENYWQLWIRFVLFRTLQHIFLLLWSFMMQSKIRIHFLWYRPRLARLGWREPCTCRAAWVPAAVALRILFMLHPLPCLCGNAAFHLKLGRIKQVMLEFHEGAHGCIWIQPYTHVDTYHSGGRGPSRPISMWSRFCLASSSRSEGLFSKRQRRRKLSSTLPNHSSTRRWSIL